MVQSAPQLLSVEEFIAQYGDSDRHKLIDGEVIALEPTGPHQQVAAFIGHKLNVEIDRQNANDLIPHRCLIKLLRTADAMVSPRFPALQLTAEHVCRAGAIA